MKILLTLWMITKMIKSINIYQLSDNRYEGQLDIQLFKDSQERVILDISSEVIKVIHKSLEDYAKLKISKLSKNYIEQNNK